MRATRGGWEVPKQPSDDRGSGWIDREPGLYDGWLQIARLFRRARVHWTVTLTLALTAAALVLGSQATSQALYPARLVLSVTEGDLEGTGQSPRTATRLRDYVVNAVFSDANLLDVMRLHDLSPSMRKRNEPFAIDDFRKDIVVEVSRNHFIYERQRGDPPRSACLTIGYSATDPRQAMLVVESLGDLIVTYEAKRRAEQLSRAVVFNDKVVGELTQEIAERERQSAALLAEAAGTGPLTTEALFGIQNSRAVAHLMEQQLRSGVRAQHDLDLRGSLEKQKSGLLFERVDWKTTEKPSSRLRPLILASALAFLLALPLCAIFVGAFGSRIHDPDDVRRLGIEPLGLVRCWPRQGLAVGESKRWKRTRRA